MQYSSYTSGVEPFVDDVVAKADEHANAEHGMTMIPPEVVTRAPGRDHGHIVL